jgi:hypothetical protein
MVNLTSCPVFTVLLTLGALFFYSSKIALDNHLLFQSHSDVAFDPSVPRDKSWHLGPQRSKSKESSKNQGAEHSSTDANDVSKENNNNQIKTLSETEMKAESAHDSDSHESQTNRPKRGVNNCHLKFPSKCPLSSNLIKYWEEETFDCFQSPLRNVSGLVAENEERRFLAFQPDLGGWNNIRMGE